MKKSLYFILIYLWPLTLSAEVRHKVCLNMIVKDEATVIERCLQSVLPFIDYWVIVDTGSTDGTEAVIQNFMKEKGIAGELHHRPWKNFGHNRNEALALAQGTAAYIFFIDADEYLSFDNGFVMPSLESDYYYLTVVHSGTQYGKVQFIKSSLKWRWVGVLHEYLSCPEARSSATIKGIKTIYTSEGARSKDPLKYKKDAEILEQALIEEPSNHRYVFYLAQSYRDALEYEKALENYKKRVSLRGWDQEVFYSLLQIAAIKESLKYAKEEVIESYFEAFAYRPSRAEPLYRIANILSRHGDFEKGYKVATIASSISRPHDVLFVEDWIYQYGIELEQSVCAYWIGEYQKCQAISLKLLDKPGLPENVRDCVKKNLSFANTKLLEAALLPAAS